MLRLKSLSRRKTIITSIVLLTLVVLSIFAFLFCIKPIGRIQPQEIMPQTKENQPVVSFSAVGDFGANNTTKQVLKESAKNTDFIIALGDFGYDQVKNEHDWCDFVHAQVGETYPFMLVDGNHDVEGDDGFGRGHFSVYASCLPNRMSGMVGDYGGNYYFDYKNTVRVISLSPNLKSINEKGDFKRNTKDYNWLVSVIDAARKKSVPWIVLTMHENCVTIGVKKCEIGEDLLNLAAEKRVDLVFQGHEHAYMRSGQLKLSGECVSISPINPSSKCVDLTQKSKYKKGEGPILVINGTGGYDLRDVDPTLPDKVYFVDWHGKNISPINGPTKVQIYDDRMDVQYIGINGKTIDAFTISR